MDAVGALRLSPLRRGLAIDSTVDIFTFYVSHRHVYGEQWIKFMKDGVNASFFFSSRRRHKICGRDWSSDVCSSDLKKSHGFHGFNGLKSDQSAQSVAYCTNSPAFITLKIFLVFLISASGSASRITRSANFPFCNVQIGRASCRERV